LFADSRLPSLPLSYNISLVAVVAILSTTTTTTTSP
jgi:hypothetical protein